VEQTATNGNNSSSGSGSGSSKAGTKGLTSNLKKEAFSPTIDNKHAQKWQVGTKGLISTSQGQNDESNGISQDTTLEDLHSKNAGVKNITKMGVC
jgi:hypothetical protein